MGKHKQATIVIASLLMSVFLVGCMGVGGSVTENSSYVVTYTESQEEQRTIDELNTHERLLAMGYSETELYSMTSDGVSLERILNQMSYDEYIDRIDNHRPIGLSGEIIVPEFYGGLYYDDEGILTVIVLEQAYNHPTSAIAIAEMQELGIIVRTAVFTGSELNTAMNALNQIAETVVAAGASYWSLDTMKNRIIVGLDPYNDEQKKVFMDLLYEVSVDPAMINIEQAVTQEMLDQRASSIVTATQSPGDMIVIDGYVDVSRTGIVFSLENCTDSEFNYGEPWDLAYYQDGFWLPVPQLPGAGQWAWTSIGYSLQPGGTKQYHIDWEQRFGELPPGRYMYIRGGWLGEYQQNRDAYALVEFYITESSPVRQLPQPDEE